MGRHLSPAVLLISPGILRWADVDFGLPHLVSLGGYLKHHTGVRVEVLDLNYEGGDHHTLLKTINDLGPLLCIGVSAYSSFDYRRVMALAAFLKERFPEVPLVAGGYHASALPEDLLVDEGGFDAVIQGEGERPMRRIVEQLLGGDAQLERIYGHDLEPVLDDLPMYDWGLLNRYWPRATQIGGKLQIVLSRGCPYHCTFCMERAKTGYSWRAYSPDRAVAELENLGRFTSLDQWVVNIADPLFGFQRSWRRQVLEGIAHKGLLPRQYWTLTRSDDLDDEDIKLFADARFSIGIGLETGSPEMQAVMQKGNNPHRYLEGFHRLARLSQKHGLTWATNVIVGHPGETPETAMQTVDFLKELFLTQDKLKGWLSVDPFRLYPGSQVHEQMETWSRDHGSVFYQPQWWHSWYDGPFRAEHLDPSSSFSFTDRVAWMGKHYPPLLKAIEERFVGSDRPVDRIYRNAMAEQRVNVSPARLASVLAKGASIPNEPEMSLKVPIGLHLRDPWVRQRENAVRRLLDRGVLRSAELTEALLQVAPQDWMPHDHAQAMLDGRMPELIEGVAPSGLDFRSTAIGLEALGVLTGKRVADLSAATGYVSVVLSRLVGGRGDVLAMHPCRLSAGLQSKVPENVRVVGHDPRTMPLPEDEVDAYWLGAAMPRLPVELAERVAKGARVVTLLGPRFRPQDLVLVGPAGEQRLARVKAPVMSGRWGWVPVPQVAPRSGVHFERWDATQLAFQVLARLDLGADSASVFDPSLDRPDWAEALQRAYLAAPNRLSLHGLALQHRTVPELLRALDASKEPLHAVFATALRSEALDWPDQRVHDGLANEMQRLASMLWQHRPPPLRLVDAPALGRHGRALWLGPERVVAVSANQDREHIVQQVFHEWIHAVTDPLVQKEGRRDTRVGSDGYALHQELERVALLATEALLTEKAPEYLPGFQRWLQVQLTDQSSSTTPSSTV